MVIFEGFKTGKRDPFGPKIYPKNGKSVGEGKLGGGGEEGKQLWFSAQGHPSGQIKANGKS